MQKLYNCKTMNLSKAMRCGESARKGRSCSHAFEKGVKFTPPLPNDPRNTVQRTAYNLTQKRVRNAGGGEKMQSVGATTQSHGSSSSLSPPSSSKTLKTSLAQALHLLPLPTTGLTKHWLLIFFYWLMKIHLFLIWLHGPLLTASVKNHQLFFLCFFSLCFVPLGSN
jgi:hypothetical protein